MGLSRQRFFVQKVVIYHSLMEGLVTSQHIFAAVALGTNEFLGTLVLSLVASIVVD